MPKYIKSHSNYVIKSKHQDTSNGTIFERDITTIGGRNQFAKGQVPIYKSGNFIITINNEKSDFKKISDYDWHRSDAGEVWTLDTLKYFEKDEKTSFDKKIVIKKDYHDLRDYVYYGSCSELIRGSINNILKTFPGELFIPYDSETGVGIKGTYYSFDKNGDLTDQELEELEDGFSYERTFDTISDKNGNVIEVKDLYLIDNPFNIDIHSRYVPKDSDPLKFFAEGGVDNYVAYIKDDLTSDWVFDKNHEYTIQIDSILLDGIGEEERIDYTFEAERESGDCDTQFMVSLTAESKSTPIVTEPIYCANPGKYLGRIKLCFKQVKDTFQTTPGLKRDEDGNPIEVCCDGSLSFSGEGSSEEVIVTSYETSSCVKNMTIYLFMGNNNEIKYLIDGDEKNNFLIRIRPNNTVINKYFDSLDNFEKLLLNRESYPLYTAMLELVGENEYGLYTYTKEFTFPTTYGGYNLGSESLSFSDYINSLVEVGEFYDERFTDNMWRSMTHEAVKNFDWTFTKIYNKEDEEPFVEGGTKIQKIIRLYGREFDEVKSYIDAIDDFNTITYDNVNNIPDYFYTDKLEDDGWDVKLIHPLILSEFVGEKDSVPVDINNLFPDKYDEEGNKITTKDAEILNFFYDSDSEAIRNKINIYRVFNQDFSEFRVVPYSCSNITTVKDTKYCQKHPDECEYIDKSRFDAELVGTESCITEANISVTAENESGEDVSKGYHNDCGDIIKIYCDEVEYTSSDVNNEFMKRLLLNDKDILKHKGTVEGMEMLLSLFGLRSKERVFTDDRFFKVDGDNNIILTEVGKTYYKNYKDSLCDLYDYEIKEYTMFTTREVDEWVPEKNMYKYDWLNSTKLITYDTEDFMNGKYIPYQGLPVSYIEDKENKVRYLYPHFDSKSIYDGNPYYQMNGGWKQKSPFMFDNKNNIVIEKEYNDNSRNSSLFTETVKDVKCVQTLQEMLSNPSLATANGTICQVIDLSGRYAVIDGTLYTIYSEYNDASSNESSNFFYAAIEDNTLSVGNAVFSNYVIISNPNYPNGKQRIDLTDDYYNGKEIKIYILGNKEQGYDVDIYSNEESIGTFTVFEDGKYMDGNNYTNYFVLNDINYYNELSVLGWQQIKNDEYEYYKLNTIKEYREGNNPHNGHMRYDNGHEYLTYFKNIFKYSYNNNLIDLRQFNEEDYEYLPSMAEFGFSNLIDDDLCNKDYTKYLNEDSKCHYFGNITPLDEESVSTVYRKKTIDCDEKPNPKILKLEYGEEGNNDTCLDQIVNVKRMDINFFIKNKNEYSKEWLEEVKYIDSVILPYLEQMIPSTVIWKVNYITRNQEAWGTETKEC